MILSMENSTRMGLIVQIVRTEFTGSTKEQRNGGAHLVEIGLGTQLRTGYYEPEVKVMAVARRVGGGDMFREADRERGR